MKPVVVVDPPRADPAAVAELGELGHRRRIRAGRIDDHDGLHASTPLTCG